MYHKTLMLTVTAAATVAAPAVAAPVFLNCEMAQPDGEMMQTKVQANEEGGTVTYTFPDNGRTYTLKGFFTPDTVKFGAFTINRKDLSFTRDNSGPFMQPGHEMSYGKCVVDKTERAF